MKYDPDTALARINAADAIVVGQLGQTLDGRVATVTGESLYINGREALAHLHRMRAAVDAMIVGAGTVALDNPRMTVRLVDGVTPLRVVLDPSGRVPAKSQCFHDNAGPVLVIRAEGAAQTTDLPAAIEILTLPTGNDGIISPRRIIDTLAARDCPKVLIEGGPRTLSLAVGGGVVDHLHIMVAPMLMGSGKPGFTLPPIQKLTDAISPASETHIFDDGDVLFACDLRGTRGAVIGFPDQSGWRSTE